MYVSTDTQAPHHAKIHQRTSAHGRTALHSGLHAVHTCHARRAPHVRHIQRYFVISWNAHTNSRIYVWNAFKYSGQIHVFLENFLTTHGQNACCLARGVSGLIDDIVEECHNHAHHFDAALVCFQRFGNYCYDLS
jgi:hypothetical protein